MKEFDKWWDKLDVSKFDPDSWVYDSVKASWKAATAEARGLLTDTMGLLQEKIRERDEAKQAKAVMEQVERVCRTPFEAGAYDGWMDAWFKEHPDQGEPEPYEVWQAATECAAKIVEKECCDGCANPFYEHGLKSGWARQLAAKIRQDQD